MDCQACEYRVPDLFPSNIQVWELFQACATQWRWTFGSRTGIDYCAMKAVAKTLKIKVTRQVLQKIQFLELLAIESQDKGGE